MLEPMNALTQPIRVIFNTREKGYRLKTWTAYLGVFVLSAGDAVRYSVGWWGWGACLAIFFITSMVLLLRNQPLQTLRQVPWPLAALLGWMALSTIWSAYPQFTLLGTLAQVLTSLFAVALANLFSWRHLLRIFGNVMRFIIATSLIFEAYVSIVIQEPLAPIFKNFSGSEPPAYAYFWSQANLFTGERIQGIVGNSNLLAYVAMIGLVVFSVEYAIFAINRKLAVASIVAAMLCVALTKSASIGFAISAVLVAAVVSIAAEGKDRETRHRYYRLALSAAGAAAFMVFVYRKEVFDFLGKSSNASGRGEIWHKVFGLWEQRPVTGWGWISYWVPGVKPFEGLVTIDRVPQYHAHNAYLDIAMQIGLIGLILFLILLTFMFIKLWRLAVRHTSALYLWPILIFVGLLVQNITESRLLVEIGWVLLVLFAVKVQDEPEMLEPVGRSPKRARLIRSLRNN